jgi:hypothetical protein
VGVSLQRLRPVTAFGFLQRVAALVEREGFRVFAPILERLAQRETEMITVDRLHLIRRLAGPHGGDFGIRESIDLQVGETPIRLAIARPDRRGGAIGLDRLLRPAERLQRVRDGQMQLGIVGRLGENFTIDRQGLRVVAESGAYRRMGGAIRAVVRIDFEQFLHFLARAHVLVAR